MKKLFHIMMLLTSTLSLCANAQAQSPIKKLQGMWSDPPATILGKFCAAQCTDVGIERLNALLDDPADDSRPITALQAEATNYSMEKYFRPRLTDAALKNYPLDPADDPSFLRCEPYGFARQIVSRHQLEIRQVANDRLDFHYGEWDAHRTIYLDGRKRPPDAAPTMMGFSVGHWEGETLVVETSGIRGSIAPWGTLHGDQIHAVERYTRSTDGKTLTGFGRDDSQLGKKVGLEYALTWKEGELQRLEGKEVCLRVTLTKAELYAVEVA